MTTKLLNTEAPQVSKNDRLLRIKQVLQIVPIAKSTWWDGVRSGRFPKPIKLGSRTTCWRQSDIDKLIERGV
jgi:prophage regulatory protein